MTFFGAFLRRLGGWIAVADLIRLMAELDLDAQAVRSSVSRLKRRGMIAAERRDGAAGYRITAHGEAILRAGDARIFGRPREPGWLLVVFSIPESQRSLRHRLRSGLSGLGLGTVAPAVWIAPAHVEGEVRRLVGDLGLADHVDLFAASPLGADAARWWDLDALATEYRRYLSAWEPRLEEAGGFADHIRHLDAWRRIPFHDPGLPAGVLPADWPGEHAWEVFGALDARLSSAAWAEVSAGTTSHWGEGVPPPPQGQPRAHAPRPTTRPASPWRP
jgi:phenylacetic acid degradation operon negative regulatory protein